jgi:hypothetical protein
MQPSGNLNLSDGSYNAIPSEMDTSIVQEFPQKPFSIDVSRKIFITGASSLLLLANTTVPSTNNNMSLNVDNSRNAVVSHSTTQHNTHEKIRSIKNSFESIIFTYKGYVSSIARDRSGYRRAAHITVDVNGKDITIIHPLSDIKFDIYEGMEVEISGVDRMGSKRICVNKIQLLEVDEELKELIMAL